MDNQERHLVPYDDRLTLTDAEKLGDICFKSGMFKDVKSANQAIVKILAGREIGLGPIASMQNFHVFEGQVRPSAAMVAAQIRKSGRYDYRVKTLNENICEVEFFEVRDGKRELIGSSIFTKQDAMRAKLDGKDVYAKWPKDMLFYRAMTHGCNWFCPDVTRGMIPESTEEPAAPEPQVNVNPETGEIIEGTATVQPVESDAAPTEPVTEPAATPVPPAEPAPSEPKPVPAKPSIAVNSPKTLWDALRLETDHYNDAKPENILPHMLNAIKKQTGNPSWNWPNAKDTDGWNQAFALALSYARQEDQFAAQQGVRK